MTWSVADAPDRATLFARAVVDEFAKAGVDAVCVAPGSRSTPLTVALDTHPEIQVFSHLDERAAAFFALGRGERTGRPTPVVTTSGTATANLHPAVMEADRGRVPLLVLTADRPPELRDSGANQTADQEKLYGSAVRHYADLPEPAPEGRKLRSLRTTAARALAATRGSKPGPVHLNVPFAKPLEPTELPADDPASVPEDFAERHPLAAEGRDGPFVSVTEGRRKLAAADADRFAELVSEAERGLVVAGPMDAAESADASAVADLASAAGFPLLADPLSGLRFGSHVPETPVVGGYDGYLDAAETESWPDPDLVLRLGASPTSKPLRKYLARTGARQVVVDPAGGWREAEFRATDLVTADAGAFARAVADRLAAENVARTDDTWGPWGRAEAAHWETVREVRGDAHFEGAVLAAVAEAAPDPTTLFVSNSMPVRDLNRFAEPRAADVTALANRGVSGIDGVTSSALGAGSATEEGEETVLVTGDLAYYHDMNGLLALGRCGQEATVVLINNDGGGIFHMLPVESHESFERQFKTPHALDFAPTEDIYDLAFARTDLDGFPEAFDDALAREGTNVVEVHTDAEESHRTRERLRERVLDRL